MYSTKQKESETFATFLQRWRSLYRRYPIHILETKQVDIFSENLIPPVNYPLQMQWLSTFKEITEKGVKCEKGLLEQGILKGSKDSSASNITGEDKPKFWSINKNVTNDGVVDAHVVNRVQPAVSLQGPTNSSSPNVNQSQVNNTTSTNTNVLQSNTFKPPRNSAPKINFTCLREPIDSTLKKLVQTKVITLPEVQQYEPGPFKLAWWNDNDFCEYDRAKGHKTYICYKLKNLIQDLIEQGDVTVDTNKGSTNQAHIIYKDPFVKNNQGQASGSRTQDNTTNYTKVDYEYTINTLSEGDVVVATISINPRNKDCAVVTRRSKVTLQGVPFHALMGWGLG